MSEDDTYINPWYARCKELEQQNKELEEEKELFHELNDKKNAKITELKNENKELKEDNQQIQRDYSHLLRQKKDCEDNKYNILQKLEKIKGLINQYSPDFETTPRAVLKELKAELDEESK